MGAIDNIINMMKNENVDVKVINALKGLAHSIGFTDTLFVSSAGDNSDGSSWDKAYTSITTALDWVADNQSSGEIHLIMVGAGTFDVDTTGDPTYDENIVIIGCGKFKTILKNDHASATSVLKFTGLAGVFNLDIYTGTGSNSGILVNGTGANGFEMGDVWFSSYSATGAMDCILLDGGINYVTIKNCHFDGDTTNTTGIHLDSCCESEFENIMIHECLIGLHLDNANDDDNHFEDIEIASCATGIQIDIAGAAGNIFTNINLHSNTTNVDDNSTTTEWAKVLLHPKATASIYPSDLTGIAVTAGVGANTWGAAVTEIRSAATATKPFFIVGIVFEPDTVEKWGLRLYDDGGTNPFWEGILEPFAAAANRSQRVLFVDKFLIRQGSQISATAKSETGGNDIDVWLKIEII